MLSSRSIQARTVVLCLKREGRGNGTDAQFADRLKDHYMSRPETWYANPDIPKLGQVRGRIVLLRRFGLSERLQSEFHGRGWGINATNWGDNTPNHHGGHVQVQDFYEVTDTENIDKKINYVCEHFERASNAPTSTANAPFYVNFLSASNFWKPGCWPEKIAAKLNPAVTAFLCEKHDIGVDGKGDGCTGIVVCDWVGEDGDWDLVRAIVGMNSRLLVKEQESHLDVEDDLEGVDDGVDVVNDGHRGREGRGGRGRGQGRGDGQRRRGGREWSDR